MAGAGRGTGALRVERDKDPDQNDQFWVRVLTPHEITDAMVSDATGVMDQVRRLEHDMHQEARPTEPRPGDVPAPTPTERVISTAAFKTVVLEEKAPRCRATSMPAANS